MIKPKIVYNAGAGPVTLAFTWPPVQKPGADPRAAVRHDSITCTGDKQSIHEHTARLKTLQMDYVPAADLPAWEAFIDFAIEGEQFDYYPDATQSAHDAFTLEDDSWTPGLNFKTHDGGMFKFTLKLRKVIA